MARSRVALALCAAAAAAAAATASASPSASSRRGALPPDLALIEQRLLASYVTQLNVTGMDEDVAGFLALVQPPGVFSDLNYTKAPATGWDGYTHCQRMQEMASAYVTPASRYHGSSSLHAALLGAGSGVFSWFLSEQPQDPSNWWYQMVGCGRPVGQLSLQFADELSSDQVVNATALMARAQWVKWTETGTNAADIALVHIASGLLNGNESYVAEAFAKMWSTVVFSDSLPPNSPEGPKPDGSFMQHGAQLYNGNYGASWTKDVLSNVAIAAGTQYNASDAAYGVVTKVILDGCGRMIHVPSLQWDPAVIGRQITNPGGQAVVGTGGDANLLDPQVLASAGGARGAELAALAALLEHPEGAAMPSDFTVFFNTDYAVQRRPGYYASVRMLSSRTNGGECINGQGLQALHSADGVQYLMKTGQEYQSIAPTWNWEMLPGATVQRGGTVLDCKTAARMGELPFVGGVSDDNSTGIAWMDFRDTSFGQDIAARKAYFFGDGVLLNLGSAIASAPGFAVTTTLDSRLLDPAGVLVAADGKTFETLASGNHTFPLPASPSTPFLVHHQDMGWVLLPNGTQQPAPGRSVGLLNQPVTGNWSSVGAWEAPLITNPMFTLSLDHGPSPVTRGSYAYAILPEIDATNFTAGGWRAPVGRYAIVANDGDVQAVHDTASNKLYAVAYGNVTVPTVPLPASFRASSVQPGIQSGFVLSRFTDASSGNDTLRVTFAQPDSLVSATRHAEQPLGHAYPQWWNFGGAPFVPCAWPNCPGAQDSPKGYKGPPVLKWDCYSNGTVLIMNPPTQSDMPWGIIPPFACVFAA